MSHDEQVDGLAPDHIKIPIEWDHWRSWVQAASAAGITEEGITGLLRLRIIRNAEKGGATVRRGPEVHRLLDPIGYCVRANGSGLNAGVVDAALDELTRQAEAAGALNPATGMTAAEMAAADEERDVTNRVAVLDTY